MVTPDDKRTAMHRLRGATEYMVAAYYAESHGAEASHFKAAVLEMEQAAAALGLTLLPLPPAPEVAPATAEALFEVAA